MENNQEPVALPLVTIMAKLEAWVWPLHRVGKGALGMIANYPF